MTKQDKVRYLHRPLHEWINMAINGKIALADFQRSFVWNKERSKDYIEAILDGKPVGLYLMLEVAEEPQFGARPFLDIKQKGSDIRLKKAGELVLDGQQRLTSLLQALYREEGQRCFAKIKSFASKEFSVSKVVYDSDTALNDPSKAYAKNYIPMHVLVGDADEDGVSPLYNWCSEIPDDERGMKVIVLHNRIRNFFKEHFFDRKLHFCLLSSSTDTQTAVEIFVKTNRSSVRISPFDVQVAIARGMRDVDLRSVIKDAYKSDVILRHYFEGDEESWIPKIGTEILKVACMHAGYPPQKTKYDKGREYWLFKENEKNFPNLKKLFLDFSWALKWVASSGGATKNTLPSWPHVYVLAALRETRFSVENIVFEGAAEKLVSGYYWRCLFSDRYEKDVNRRLFKDFEALRTALEAIRVSGEYSDLSFPFESENHPLYDASRLIQYAGWIGSSRLGTALVSLAMSSNSTARDWVNGIELDIDRIRELEKKGNLDRHHIFPKKLLEDAQEDKDRIDSALNGVLLDKRTNHKFSSYDPKDYVRKAIEESKPSITEKEMRERIKSHMAPYAEIATATGGIKERYQKFLDKRAEMFAEKIQDLVSPLERQSK